MDLVPRQFEDLWLAGPVTEADHLGTRREGAGRAASPRLLDRGRGAPVERDPAAADGAGVGAAPRPKRRLEERVMGRDAPEHALRSPRPPPRGAGGRGRAGGQGIAPNARAPPRSA